MSSGVNIAHTGAHLQMALLSPSYLVLLTIVAFVVWRRWKANAANPGRLPLPPGPKPLPLVGNIFDIPLGVPQWELFEAMAHKYGRYLQSPKVVKVRSLNLRRVLR